MLRITIYVKWRAIKDFPNYFISNTGIVRYKTTFKKPKIRTGRKDYYFVIVRNAETNKCHRYDVHRLVWDYFGTEPHKSGYEIHHKDGNPQNNNIENLELLLLKKHKEIHSLKNKKAA